MSKEFDYKIVRRENEDGEYFYPIQLKNREPYELEVLILPEFSRDRPKELLECSANLLCQITNGLSKNCKYDSNVTENGLNIEMTHAIRELGNLMQYIVNSSSFNNDYVQGYDVMEFERRLDMIKSLFYSGSKGLNKYL